MRPGALDLPARPGPVAAVGVALAFLSGVLLAYATAEGAAFILALLYVPLVLIDLSLAIALWVPLAYVSHAGLFGVAPTLVTLGLAGGWVARLLVQRSAAASAALRSEGFVLGTLAVFLVWLALSAGWATEPGNATSDFKFWLIPATAFAIIVTSVVSEPRVRLLLGLFVAGAVVSVLYGFVAAPEVDESAIQSAQESATRRLAGTSKDPNFLAAGLVPALIYAVVLGRRGRWRWPLATVAILIMVVGFAQTGSRGGLVAAVAAVLGAFVVFRGQRRRVVAFLGAIAAIALVLLAISPGSLSRLVELDSSGSGRNDVWRVGWRMGSDNATLGVGLNNFQVRAREYTRRPGKLERADQLVDNPHVAHNTYLQLWAETGIVGLLLFLLFLVACMRSASRAARSFERQHNWRGATAAKGSVLAILAFAAAAFFVSAGQDPRFWIVLAVGPTLHAIALHREMSMAAQPVQFKAYGGLARGNAQPAG